jgi:hypothetical protein
MAHPPKAQSKEHWESKDAGYIIVIRPVVCYNFSIGFRKFHPILTESRP